MIPMLFRTELRKARTTRVLPIAIAAFAGVVVLLASVSVGDLPQTAEVAEVGRLLLSIAGLGAIPLALVGAGLVTSEHRHGTAVPTFLAVPRRWPVIAAKAATAATIAAVWTVGALTLELVLVAGPWLTDHGYAVSDLMAGETARLAAVVVLVNVLHAVMGVGLGALAREPSVVVLVTLTWFLVVEGQVVGRFWPDLLPFLPGEAAGRAIGLAGGAVGQVRWSALTVLAAWALGLALLGSVRTVRTDVTAR